MLEQFEALLSAAQREIWEGLTNPGDIQAFLDAIPYSAEDANRSPLHVLRDRQAHCLDGALFAALALHRLGYPPLIVDLLPEPGMDDDHVLAIYQRHGHWGALAKSNFVGLRFREPVYRTLRELAMSYFEGYYNVDGVKTLRRYTRPINLSSWAKAKWTTEDKGVDALEKHLKTLKGIQLVSPAMVAELSKVDQRAYEAGLFGANPEGLYEPQG